MPAIREVRFVTFFIWLCKNSSSILLWFIHLVCFLSLQTLWIICFLSSGSAWKIDQCLCWYLYLGHCTIGPDWFTMCDDLHCVFILCCSFVYFCSWVCSNASSISIFKHLCLNSWGPEVFWILSLKLSSGRYSYLSCRKICWMKKVVEYYGNSHSRLWFSLSLDTLKMDKQLLSDPVEIWVFLAYNSWHSCKSS